MHAPTLVGPFTASLADCTAVLVMTDGAHPCSCPPPNACCRCADLRLPVLNVSLLPQLPAIKLPNVTRAAVSNTWPVQLWRARDLSHTHTHTHTHTDLCSPVTHTPRLPHPPSQPTCAQNQVISVRKSANTLLDESTGPHWMCKDCPNGTVSHGRGFACQVRTCADRCTRCCVCCLRRQTTHTLCRACTPPLLQVCPPGTFADRVSGECRRCKPGYYSPSKAADVCQVSCSAPAHSLLMSSCR